MRWLVVAVGSGSLGELHADLKGLAAGTAAKEAAELVACDEASDHLGLVVAGVCVEGLEGSREHALADEGRVGFRVVVCVDCVVAGPCRQLGAAVEDGLDAGGEVDDANCGRGSIVESHSLDRKCLRGTGEAVEPVILVESVEDLDWGGVSRGGREKSLGLDQRLDQRPGESGDVRPSCLTWTAASSSWGGGIAWPLLFQPAVGWKGIGDAMGGEGVVFTASRAHGQSMCAWYVKGV